jgi:hypothetical protein
VQSWICRSCRSATRVRVPSCPAPEPPSKHRDRYRIGKGQIVCLNCAETAILRSNQAVADEVSRFSRYLAERPAPSCPNEACAHHRRPLDDTSEKTLYQKAGLAKGKSKRWYGYTPYDPSMIPKLLDVHRAYHNWVHVGDGGLTRAERFGLARGKIRRHDIIYYQ